MQSVPVVSGLCFISALLSHLGCGVFWEYMGLLFSAVMGPSHPGLCVLALGCSPSLPAPVLQPGRSSLTLPSPLVLFYF